MFQKKFLTVALSLTELLPPSRHNRLLDHNRPADSRKNIAELGFDLRFSSRSAQIYFFIDNFHKNSSSNFCKNYKQNIRFKQVPQGSTLPARHSLDEGGDL